MNYNQFKQNSFFIPLNSSFEICNYKQFSDKEWKNNLLHIFKMIVSYNQQISDEDLNNIASKQLNDLLTNIKQAKVISYDNPCVSIAYPIANCWFIIFLVDAFTFYDDKNNLNKTNPFTGNEQCLEILKANHNPLDYCFNIIESLK